MMASNNKTKKNTKKQEPDDLDLFIEKRKIQNDALKKIVGMGEKQKGNSKAQK